jgi:hypothetical protein
MFYESLGAVWAVEAMRHPSQQFVVISESVRLLGLSTPCITRDSSSLIISDSLWDVWAVESKSHT